MTTTIDFSHYRRMEAERDEARRWAIRMKSQRDESDNALYKLHRSYCALRAENARLRARLQELTDSRQDAR